MRWVLFWVAVGIFLVVVAGTLGALFFGFGDLEPGERATLFRVFIVEVGLAVVALFYSLFRLKGGSGTLECRLRLDLREYSDVRQLVGRPAILSPLTSDGTSLDTISVMILDDNGPYVPLELPDSVDAVYITIDSEEKHYSGSFPVGTYHVDLTEAEVTDGH